ncbi:MAG: hypothetical protein ACP5HM_04645 [Anaerolineae bacterium]
MLSDQPQLLPALLEGGDGSVHYPRSPRRPTTTKGVPGRRQDRAVAGGDQRPAKGYPQPHGAGEFWITGVG